ncbi:MarR family transcriptional regulator [Elizabethkingia argentiflava]|uniref:MarR family transcriptional regulator n=1 Tax=Elizabethkingia argenteiflava TaxID=2681556 RepID=A0A845PQ57_9FLAO|nr:MarR family transcriptional regulator [Elizabethkingia argenteiflava]NAW50302.1 MarR family transcriptional regulator [Elizabethkingia argenteiflava]
MEDHLKLKNQLCFPIYAFAKEMVNHYRPLLEELQLTYPQYLVLLILWEETEQTVGQLGEKLFLDTGTLTPLLKRMEQKEMIIRSRSSTDERVVYLSVTQKGALLRKKAEDIPRQLMESMNISEEDLNALKNIITKILNKQK